MTSGRQRAEQESAAESGPAALLRGGMPGSPPSSRTARRLGWARRKAGRPPRPRGAGAFRPHLRAEWPRGPRRQPNPGRQRGGWAGQAALAILGVNPAPQREFPEEPLWAQLRELP